MMSSYRGEASWTSRSRVTKVKPVLRKLGQSGKHSLDLDRAAVGQNGQYGVSGWNGRNGQNEQNEQNGLGLGIYEYGDGIGTLAASASRSVHDVSFAHTGRRGHHSRSMSGASQLSTSTTGSGQRYFVHPFQQTPQPYTPPIVASYQNSLRANSLPRRRESEHSYSPSPYSPAVGEDEVQVHFRDTLRSASNLSNRTPSLSSTSPIVSQPSLRIQTKQFGSSRLALTTSPSRTSLDDHISPISPSASNLNSPEDDEMNLYHTIRSSIDKEYHAPLPYLPTPEELAAARRRYAEKEAIKEEIQAKKDIRELEKRNEKEAKLILSGGHRRGSSFTSSKASKATRAEFVLDEEKIGYYDKETRSSTNGRVYTGTGPKGYGEDSPKDERTTKQKAKKSAHDAWTKFMMWFRTRLLRMGMLPDCLSYAENKSHKYRKSRKSRKAHNARKAHKAHNAQKPYRVHKSLKSHKAQKGHEGHKGHKALYVYA